MKTTRYFRTKDAAVIDAHEELENHSENLQNKANKFAKEFGGKPLFRRFSQSFAGLKFSPEKKDKFWTKPDSNGIQKPISRPRKDFTDKDKMTLKTLQAIWNTSYPKLKDGSKVIEDLCNAIGISYSNLFLNGFEVFREGAYVYFSTSNVKNKINAEEITGGAYEQAGIKGDLH